MHDVDQKSYVELVATLYRDCSEVLANDWTKQSKQCQGYFAWYDNLSEAGKKVILQRDPLQLCYQIIGECYTEIGQNKTILTKNVLKEQMREMRSNGIWGCLNTDAKSYYRYLLRYCAINSIFQYLQDNIMVGDTQLEEICHENLNQFKTKSQDAGCFIANHLLNEQFVINEKSLDVIYGDLLFVQQQAVSSLRDTHQKSIVSCYKKLNPITKRRLKGRFDRELIRRKMLVQYLDIGVGETMRSDDAQKTLGEACSTQSRPVQFLAKDVELYLTQLVTTRFYGKLDITKYTNQILYFYLMTVIANFWDEMCYFRHAISREACLKNIRDRERQVDSLVFISLFTSIINDV